ncbi:hypothetical protein Ancab_039463 [Ancistrocladus abbreviatus]
MRQLSLMGHERVRGEIPHKMRIDLGQDESSSSCESESGYNYFDLPFEPAGCRSSIRRQSGGRKRPGANEPKAGLPSLILHLFLACKILSLSLREEELAFGRYLRSCPSARLSGRPSRRKAEDFLYTESRSVRLFGSLSSTLDLDEAMSFLIFVRELQQTCLKHSASRQIKKSFFERVRGSKANGSVASTQAFLRSKGGKAVGRLIASLSYIFY